MSSRRSADFSGSQERASRDLHSAQRNVAAACVCIVIFALLAGLAQGLLVKKIGIGPVSIELEPRRLPEPSTPSPAPTPDSPPASTASSRGSIYAVIQNPGGCNERYTVGGQVFDPPAIGNKLWIVSMLLADPANGLDRPLYYPKMPVEERSGVYKIELDANRDPGVRKGRFLLVSADNQASAALQANHELTELPPGGIEIARSADGEQRC